MRELLILSYIAKEDIPPFRFVAYENDGVRLATNSLTDVPRGLSSNNKAITYETDTMADCIIFGVGYVECATGILAGDLLTTDNEGKAVKAQPGDKVWAVAETYEEYGMVTCFLVQGITA